ncbi:MAG: zinc-domain-containing protein [Thaumarchaeota archaeon 13_1_40CM_2_39_4]|nr:MAG: zinc-domain-containing protein [Thaumarchaeota archaeon 13_1_40CM_3_38_6]OLD41263.1 MAG: zinc-domain-containing protein [Thaumarchaeota archaeon 13_1_40CM_2_39_4]
MDAKCPNCDRVAVLDEEVTTVKCPHCGFEAKYDDYLKLMKEKIGEMAENLQFDRPGF